MNTITPPLTFTTDPDEKADLVAAFLESKPPNPDTILSKDRLLRWAGVRGPQDGSSHKEYEDHSLWLCQFTVALRGVLMIRLSRLLVNVPTQGYRLLAPGDVTGAAEDRAYQKMAKELGRLHGTLKLVDHNLLTAPERQQNTDAKAQAASVKSILRAENRRRRQRDAHLEAVAAQKGAATP